MEGRKTYTDLEKGLSLTIMNQQKEIERLNNIISKAIEYIEKEIDIEKICNQQKSLTICKKELLKILSGEDNE